MRFPVSIYYKDANETLEINDHEMVFQLADVMNEKNGQDAKLDVNFIPWVESSANAPADTPFRRPDGTVPGGIELAANPTWATNTSATCSDPGLVTKVIEEYNEWVNIDKEKIAKIATNVFRAHKAAVEAGNFDYSESQYIQYVLKTELNVTDEAASTSDLSPSWLMTTFTLEPPCGRQSTKDSVACHVHLHHTLRAKYCTRLRSRR
jgi:hypothetical protein